MLAYLIRRLTYDLIRALIRLWTVSSQARAERRRLTRATRDR